LLPATLFALVDMRFGLMASIFCAALIALAMNYFLSKSALVITSTTASTFQLTKNAKVYRLLLLIFFSLHVVINIVQWGYTAHKDMNRDKHYFSTLAAIANHYRGRPVFIINHASPLDLYYFQFYQHAFSNQVSDIQVLTTNYSNTTFEILDSHCIKARSDAGLIFNNDDLNSSNNHLPPVHHRYAQATLNGIFNVQPHYFSQGEVFRQKHIVVTIKAVNEEKRTTEIHFCFEKDLLSDSYVFLDGNKITNADSLTTARLFADIGK
jgi:hypothetical protein